MEAIKILKSSRIDWDYDEQADVLYLSIGAPKKAIGMDIGDGVILRYDEAHNEIVGLTLVGLRERIAKSSAQGN